MIQKVQNIRGNIPKLFDLGLGIVTALFFSFFLYMEHYAVTLKLLNTLFGILSLALFLYMPKRAVLWGGFFIGVLWFYWIGYSFKYNGIEYIAPIITLLFALIYMLFFGILALSKNVALRALMLFGLSFAEPFDFNWLQIELLFVESYIGIEKLHLLFLLFALSLPHYVSKKYRFFSLIFLLLSLHFPLDAPQEAPLRIKLIATDIAQEKKWLKETLSPTVAMIFKEIANAKKEGYEMIVFPESVFPFYMNKAPMIIKRLQAFSEEITIVAGALLSEKKQHYNVTYIFHKGEVTVAKKLVLVPFGEYIPLPKFARKFVNEFFFAGASDFQKATKPTDFQVKGITFRNAICYEATCQEIYEGEFDFIVASSNNAWFTPSIEPTLQNLLMRYYARKNQTIIYHSANYKGTGIVK